MVGRADCGPVTKVAFSPSGGKLAAATADGGIIVWDAV